MTPAVRHGVQATIVGSALIIAGGLLSLVLAFVDRAAIADWAGWLLFPGAALMLGGLATTELFVRRRP